MRHGAFTCLLLAALALVSSAATAEGAGRCNVRNNAILGVAHSRVLTLKGDAVVYRVRRAAFDTDWACSRTHRGRVLMGRDDSYAMRHALYGPTEAFDEIRIAGDWITAIHEHDSSPECGKYGETECEGRLTTLVIVDVALGLSAHEDVYFPEGETAKWLISPQGGVAWLYLTEDELHGCAAAVQLGKLSCPERTLWTGSHVDPGSVHLSRTTLTWTALGGLHTAAV